MVSAFFCLNEIKCLFVCLNEINTSSGSKYLLLYPKREVVKISFVLSVNLSVCLFKLNVNIFYLLTY